MGVICRSGPMAVLLGIWRRPPSRFQKHGDSGLEISSLYPYVARFADDLCVIRSMYCDTPTHSPGILQMNTGSIFVGRPSLGSWLSYGLGTENENLPSYVVMVDPRGGAPGRGGGAWSPGFMPAVYQGTLFRSQGSPLLDLETPRGISPSSQRRGMDLLGRLNHRHLEQRPGYSELVAREFSPTSWRTTCRRRPPKRSISTGSRSRCKRHMA